MKLPSSECVKTRASAVWKPRIKMQWKATGSVQRTASRPDQRWTGSPAAAGRERPSQLPEDPRAGRDLDPRLPENDPRLYFRVTVRVADPPRLLLTVTLPGFE